MSEHLSNSRDHLTVLGITSFFVILYILITSILFRTWFHDNVFKFHIGDIYPYFLIMAIFLIGFGVLLLYRSLVKEHSSLYLLILAITFSGLSYFFGFLNFDPTGTIDFRETRLFQLQILSQTIGIFLFYLHYELNTHDFPRTKLLAPIIILIWPYSLLNIFYFITNNYPSTTLFNQFEIYSLILLQIGAIVVFSWLFYNGIQISQIYFKGDLRTKLITSFQLAGVFILFLGVLFQVIETIFPLDIWHTPLNVLAILLIGVSYYIDANVLLFAPVNVKLFGVVDNAGRTLYYKAIDPEFQADEAISTTSELFGGLTIAFSSIGQEVAKSDHGVDSLQFGDRSIVVEYINPYYLVVIANRSTFFLQKEMEEYLLELKTQFPEVKPTGNIPKEEFEKLNQKFFPVLLDV